jgi:DNA-binding NtrC family response regulator
MSSVLLIEDNLLLCKMEERHIAVAFPNIELHVAHNDKDARRAAAETMFDAVVMDCHIPEGDCLSLISDISRTSPNAAIVIVSADPPKDLRTKNRRDKIFEIIEKPFEAEELIACLRRALNMPSSAPERPTDAKFCSDSLKVRPSFDRHEMLNILTGMKLGIRAFESDLMLNAENSPEIRQTIAEYVPKILQMIERATALLKQAQ